eukprot:jgi/Bigna1/91333/estExt_fgenesh1_pg.C_970005
MSRISTTTSSGNTRGGTRRHISGNSASANAPPNYSPRDLKAKNWLGKSLKVELPGDLKLEINTIAEFLSIAHEKEKVEWKIRVNLMKRLQDICSLENTRTMTQVVPLLLKHKNLFTLQIEDRRSSVLKEATLLAVSVCQMAREMDVSSCCPVELYVELTTCILESLFKVVPVTIKVMSSSASKAIQIILKDSPDTPDRKLLNTIIALANHKHDRPTFPTEPEPKAAAAAQDDPTTTEMAKSEIEKKQKNKMMTKLGGGTESKTKKAQVHLGGGGGGVGGNNNQGDVSVQKEDKTTRSSMEVVVPLSPSSSSLPSISTPSSKSSPSTPEGQQSPGTPRPEKGEDSPTFWNDDGVAIKTAVTVKARGVEGEGNKEPEGFDKVHLEKKKKNSVSGNYNNNDDHDDAKAAAAAALQDEETIQIVKDAILKGVEDSNANARKEKKVNTEKHTTLLSEIKAASLSAEGEKKGGDAGSNSTDLKKPWKKKRNRHTTSWKAMQQRKKEGVAIPLLLSPITSKLTNSTRITTTTTANAKEEKKDKNNNNNNNNSVPNTREITTTTTTTTTAGAAHQGGGITTKRKSIGKNEYVLDLDAMYADDDDDDDDGQHHDHHDKKKEENKGNDDDDSNMNHHSSVAKPSSPLFTTPVKKRGGDGAGIISGDLDDMVRASSDEQPMMTMVVDDAQPKRKGGGGSSSSTNEDFKAKRDRDFKILADLLDLTEPFLNKKMLEFLLDSNVARLLVSFITRTLPKHDCDDEGQMNNKKKMKKKASPLSLNSSDNEFSMDLDDIDDDDDEEEEINTTPKVGMISDGGRRTDYEKEEEEEEDLEQCSFVTESLQRFFPTRGWITPKGLQEEKDTRRSYHVMRLLTDGAQGVAKTTLLETRFDDIVSELMRGFSEKEARPNFFHLCKTLTFINRRYSTRFRDLLASDTTILKRSFHMINHLHEPTVSELACDLFFAPLHLYFPHRAAKQLHTMQKKLNQFGLVVGLCSRIAKADTVGSDMLAATVGFINEMVSREIFKARCHGQEFFMNQIFMGTSSNGEDDSATTTNNIKTSYSDMLRDTVLFFLHKYIDNICDDIVGIEGGGGGGGESKKRGVDHRLSDGVEIGMVDTDTFLILPGFTVTRRIGVCKLKLLSLLSLYHQAYNHVRALEKKMEEYYHVENKNDNKKQEYRDVNDGDDDDGDKDAAGSSSDKQDHPIEEDQNCAIQFMLRECNLLRRMQKSVDSKEVPPTSTRAHALHLANHLRLKAELQCDIASSRRFSSSTAGSSTSALASLLLSHPSWQTFYETVVNYTKFQCFNHWDMGSFNTPSAVRRSSIAKVDVGLGSNFARKLGYEMIDAVDQGNDDDQKMVWNADDSSDEEDDEGDTDNIISQRPNNKKMTTTARNLKQESKTSSSSSSWASYAKNDTSDTVGDLDLLAASVGSMSLNDDDECEL